MATRRLVAVKNLGRMRYGEAMKRMQAACNQKLEFLSGKISNEPNDTLFIVEHSPVYTIGTRTHTYLGQSESEPDVDRIDERLKRLGAEFWVTDRGGLITFHGPGQLVCYPVLNLRHYKPSARWYIDRLEQVIIDTCEEFNLRVGRTTDIGVWIEDRKIAAIGVHVRKYITSHGLALNCNTKLSWFDHIVPCGIEGKGVTSLSKELNTTINIGDALPILLEKFKNQFNCDYINSN